jgi:hypothetical protein
VVVLSYFRLYLFHCCDRLHTLGAAVVVLDAVERRLLLELLQTLQLLHYVPGLPVFPASRIWMLTGELLVISVYNYV